MQKKKKYFRWDYKYILFCYFICPYGAEFCFLFSLFNFRITFCILSERFVERINIISLLAFFILCSDLSHILLSLCCYWFFAMVEDEIYRELELFHGCQVIVYALVWSWVMGGQRKTSIRSGFGAMI
ncbi:hypothetical protein EDC01DRAFT_7546 [Geopyxis carbonaria]|nr:hypothetical protein EDC01DRAFT_7546 [Geopyxis carbonaria]